MVYQLKAIVPFRKGVDHSVQAELMWTLVNRGSHREGNTMSVSDIKQVGSLSPHVRLTLMGTVDWKGEGLHSGAAGLASVSAVSYCFCTVEMLMAVYSVLSLICIQ